MIALASSMAAGVAGGVVLGVGTSLVFPSLALMVIEREPAERGAALRAFTSFFDVGVGIGAPVAGLVAAVAGYEAAFWMAAACASAGAVIAALPERA